MTKEQLKALPKVELHCHLDGSLSHSLIEKRLGRSVDPSELSVTNDCQSLAEYLEKFDLPGQCIMDREGMEAAGYDVLQTMHRENVVYAEIRFAPMLSVSEHMNAAQTIEALLRGLERGKQDFGVDYNVICCAMRHHSEEMNLSMLKAAREYLGSGVCAADLAGGEAAFPMSGFMNLFAEAKRMGMPFTLHAGECGNAQNIMDSIEAGAARIGHGIAMRGHSDIKKIVKKNHIGIEMCPISNLQTKAVANEAEYPLREFLDEGIAVSINTDNRTVSKTSLTKELEFCQEHYGLTNEEVILVMKNAVDTAFLTEADKDGLYRRMGLPV